MSFDYSFPFGPATPPEYSYEDTPNEPSFYVAHSRASSQSSTYSQDSMCDTFNNQLMTPIKSPIRQHGPLLLPKIRPQDQTIESEPKRMKMTPISKKQKNFRPSHTRSYTNPEFITLMSSTPPAHNHSRSSSAMSPVAMSGSSFGHQRRSSSSSLDGQTLGKYGFPTYRQMPNFISSVTNSQTQGYLQQPNYAVNASREPSPMRSSLSYDDVSSMDGSIIDEGPTTTLMTYLTSPNPSPALVRQINVHIRDPNVKHFWWDIRQLRPWSSFNMTTINSIPGLPQLLTIPLPCASLAIPARTSSNPETEASLTNIYSTFYTQKLNSALLLSQGPRHLLMRTSNSSTAPSEPTFISAYTDDNTALIYGRGLGRVVGLVKSFDRWNTGMRVEGNHKKVEYLRGLAHLHRCMREHGCRYGFILTEIELVVVRNGTELTPIFGYMEVATIQLCEHAPPPPPPTQTTFNYASSNSSYASSETSTSDLDLSSSTSFIPSPPSDSETETPTPNQPHSLPSQPPQEPQKMTALLALWYLHMLARDNPLPGEATWKSEIGAPAEGTRRKCMAKDEWLPEPQLAEKREAKRCRGWVWPEEAVNRKELGRRKVVYK